MDETEIKHVVEAALLAAGKPLTLDKLAELFKAKGDGPDRAAVKRALETLAEDYQVRGVELKEVATGFRIQVKRSMSDWLQPLWEERAPRYTRALLETLALIAYRQPITRAEIEEVRGVVVSTNIIRTLLERNWVRVVGHRDVPGKPAMFGTTKDFLDYFGLKKLEDLPTLAELKDGMPELSPQADLIESLEADARAAVEIEVAAAENAAEHGVPTEAAAGDGPVERADLAADTADDESAAGSELQGPDLISDEPEPVEDRPNDSASEDGEIEVVSAQIIPLRAAHSGADGND
jgi:segregation and condensation protein B